MPAGPIPAMGAMAPGFPRSAAFFLPERAARWTAAWTVLGIVVNRLNVSIIAFNWYADVHYFPTWQEIIVTLMVIFTELWVFRWVVTRLPVLNGRH